MDPLDPPEVLPPKAASALPEQREDDSWDKRTAPHAAHSGPPSHTPRETEHPLATRRGHAAKHGHASDRKAAAPGHGGRHLPPTDIKKGNKKTGGAGWVGPEADGVAEMLDEEEPVTVLDAGDPNAEE